MSFENPLSGATNSFFEGTEKKVELVIHPSLPSLRERGEAYWSEIMQRAGASILSMISTDGCDAYLLSESSLFVFDHKVLMITCGRTCLPEAVLELLEQVPPEKVLFLIYERKNEIFPHSQPTSFHEDARRLNEQLPGKVFRFGDEDEHHLYLFHLDRPFTPDNTDPTTELLMYGIDRQARELFSATGSAPRDLLNIETVFPGYRVDDHHFEPNGYSLNAIAQDRYLTVHVTPTEINSYVSVETNHATVAEVEGLARYLLELFRPRAFDLISWESLADLTLPQGEYELKAHVSKGLSCGYRVDFLNFYMPRRRVRSAVEIPLDCGSV